MRLVSGLHLDHLLFDMKISEIPKAWGLKPVPTSETISAIAKTVEWSYPSSSNAQKFGFGKSGCYTVETACGCEPPEAIAGFKTLEEAKEFADKMPQAWGKSIFFTP